MLLISSWPLRKWLTILLICCWAPVTIAKSLMVEKDFRPQAIDSHVSMLIDPHGEWSIAQVMQKTNAFKPSHGRRDLHIGYTSDVIWLKLHLRSQSPTLELLALMFQYPYLDRLDFYTTRHGKVLSELKSGFSLAPNKRAIADLHPAFPVTLKPYEQQTLYIRAKANGSMTLDAKLFGYLDYVRQSEKMLSVQALFAGMVIALAIYNLFLGLVLRQRPFLLYSAFCAVFGLATSTANGLGGLMLWPLIGPIIDHIVPTGFSFAVALAVLFARYFLNLKEHAPLFYRLQYWVFLLCLLLAAATLLLPIQLAVKIMSLLGVSMAAFLLLCGYRGIRANVPAARYYLLAWTMLLIGAALVSIRNTGALPSNFITVYALQIGASAEMLLLSFGLAANFNELKRQKDIAQDTLLRTLSMQEQILEHRVSERTANLEEAKQQLASMAYLDSLTQLYNRSGLTDRFNQLKKRSRGSFAVLLIDLDGFKPVNDQHGHASGDKLLKIIAERMAKQSRPDDIVARFGGDEFAMVCNELSTPHAAIAFASRLQQHLSTPIALSANVTVSVGATIGICFNPPLHSELSKLLHYADMAMYKIKKSNKGHVGLIDLDQQLFIDSTQLSETPERFDTSSLA